MLRSSTNPISSSIPPSSTSSPKKLANTKVAKYGLVSDRLAHVPIIHDGLKMAFKNYMSLKQAYPILAGSSLNKVEHLTQLMAGKIVVPLASRLFLEEDNSTTGNNKYMLFKHKLAGNIAIKLNDMAMQQIDVLENRIPLLFEPTEKVWEGFKPVYSMTLKPFVIFFLFWINLVHKLCSYVDTSVTKVKTQGSSVVGDVILFVLYVLDSMIFRTRFGIAIMEWMYKTVDHYLPEPPTSSKKPQNNDSENVVAENLSLAPPPSLMSHPRLIKVWGTSAVLKVQDLRATLNELREQRLKKLAETARRPTSTRREKTEEKPNNTIMGIVRSPTKFVSSLTNVIRNGNVVSAGMESSDTNETNRDTPTLIGSLLYLFVSMFGRIKFAFIMLVTRFDRLTHIVSLTKFFVVQIQLFYRDAHYTISCLPEKTLNLAWVLTKFSSEKKFPGLVYYTITFPSRYYLLCERIFIRGMLFMDHIAIRILPASWSAALIHSQRQLLLLRHHIAVCKGGLVAKTLVALRGIILLMKEAKRAVLNYLRELFVAFFVGTKMDPDTSPGDPDFASDHNSGDGFAVRLFNKIGLNGIGKHLIPLKTDSNFDLRTALSPATKRALPSMSLKSSRTSLESDTTITNNTAAGNNSKIMNLLFGDNGQASWEALKRMDIREFRKALSNDEMEENPNDDSEGDMEDARNGDTLLNAPDKSANPNNNGHSDNDVTDSEIGSEIESAESSLLHFDHESMLRALDRAEMALSKNSTPSPMAKLSGSTNGSEKIASFLPNGFIASAKINTTTNTSNVRSDVANGTDAGVNKSITSPTKVIPLKDSVVVSSVTRTTPSNSGSISVSNNAPTLSPIKTAT